MREHQNILVFNPALAKRVGFSESIVLQQWYCWQAMGGFKEWIYNAYEEWQKQFPFWTISEFKKVVKSLEDMGLLKRKRSQSQVCIEKLKERRLFRAVQRGHSEWLHNNFN